MELTVSPSAHEWFKEELELKSGESVHIFGKYGGSTAVHTGFSVGVEIKPVENPTAIFEVNDISYFTEENDDWFFHGYDLLIDLDKKTNEPVYEFKENLL